MSGEVGSPMADNTQKQATQQKTTTDGDTATDNKQKSLAPMDDKARRRLGISGLANQTTSTLG